MLNRPVYTPKVGSQMFLDHKKALEKKDTFHKVLDDFITDNPSLSVMGIFSQDKIGVEYGSEAEKDFDKELKKHPEKGYKIFKKNSKTLKFIQESIGKEIEEMNSYSRKYRFSVSDYFDFGRRTRYSTHTVDGKLYFSAEQEAIDSDEIELVDYADYLRAVADKVQMEKGVE